MGRRTRGVLMIVLGLALTFFAAGVYARYEHRAREAGTNAQILLQEVKVQIEEKKLTTTKVEAPEGQMAQTTVDGRGVIGILQIEKAGIQLPVLDKWSYENLQYGPCRYSGSLKEGNLVFLGHNYADHLSDLDLVKKGDTVDFFDVTGVCHTFSVVETVSIAPTDIEAVTASEYPLTIFTCTPGGQSRYVVYCSVYQ